MQFDNTRVPIHSPNDIETRFMKLMGRLWSFSSDQLPEDEQDLTMSQLRLIDFIGKHSGCHLQDIADGLQLTPPTVSVAIRKLEDGGWLERRQDPDDGRATCVFLTSKSEKTIQKAVAHQQRFRTLFFSGLTETEQQTLLDLFEKGIVSIENQVSNHLSNQEK